MTSKFAMRRPIHLSRRGLLGAAVTAIAAPRAFAQPLSDLTRLYRDNPLRIAMPRFASPPFFEASGPDNAGIDVALSQAIARTLETDVTFDRQPATFDEAVDLIAAGAADLAICKLSRTVRRGRLIRYSRPYAVFNHGLIANRVRLAQMTGNRPTEQVVREFSGILGVIGHSAFAEFAGTSFPKASIREFADWTSMIDAVRAEEIDMAYRDDFEIKKLLVDDPSLTVVARSITLNDKTDTLAIGIRPDATHLAAFVDLYLDISQGGAVLKTDEIVARYRASKGV
jgi:polar amino acid transport system substrate-binding protein